MFNYIADGQMTIFDLLKPDEPPIEPERKPEIKKGVRVYRIVLDVVETGAMDHYWDLTDRYGYSALNDAGGYITFWTPDIGDTVFTDKNKAYAKAESLKNTYKVIRHNEMKIIKEKNYINLDSNSKYTETVKMLEGNMVYFKRWPCYPFMEIFKTREQAEKKFKEKIKEITDNINHITRTEIRDTVEMQDMYLAQNGVWSDYQYVNFNRPVTLPHHS